MPEKQLYALLVLVSVGLLSFVLRALPFAVFGAKGNPPAAIRFVGRLLSPAAIAILVAYCYAGEIVKAAGAGLAAGAAPWAAGLLTLALQFRFRNPLLSIAAGTALYMMLVR